MQKIEITHAFLPGIKESCNLIGQENFGLKFVKQNLSDKGFPQENRNYKVSHFRALSAKSNTKFW